MKDTPVKVYPLGGPTVRLVCELMTNLVNNPAVKVTSPDEADVILFDEIKILEENNDPNKIAALIVLGEFTTSDFRLPRNVVLINALEVIKGVKDVIAHAQGQDTTEASEVSAKVSCKPDALKILVIDDDPGNIRSAKELLAEHQLMVAESCEEALAVLKDNTFDVVLSDLRLPMGPRKIELFSYGIILMIEAAKRGTKRIVVYTDVEHHPDKLGIALVGQYQQGTPINIEGAAVKILASRSVYGNKDWSHALSEALK